MMTLTQLSLPAAESKLGIKMTWFNKPVERINISNNCLGSNTFVKLCIQSPIFPRIAVLFPIHMQIIHPHIINIKNTK